jgi:hypothetical protein
MMAATDKYNRPEDLGRTIQQIDRTAGQALYEAKGSVWRSFTPIFNQVTTPPTVGNATLAGRYMTVGSTLVYKVQFIWGSSTVAGSGAFMFSLPIPVISGERFQGAAKAFNSSNGTHYTGLAWLDGVNVAPENELTAFFNAQTARITHTGAGNPFGEAWATGDSMDLQIVYQGDSEVVELDPSDETG